MAMMAPIAQGRTAQVYPRGETEILKLLYQWCPEEWATREAEISQMVFSRGLPMPKCLGTVRVDGRLGIVYERINGCSMLSIMRSRPWDVKRQMKLLAELHSQIHSHAGDGLPLMRPSLERAIKAAMVLPLELKRRVAAALSELEDGSALCHFDFHPDQVMMTANGPKVIDWMTALQGNPLADVARTLVIMRFASTPKASWAVRRMTDAMRYKAQEAYLREYLLLRPQAEAEQVHRWMIPVAAARLAEGIDKEKEPILAFLEGCLAESEGA